MHFLIIAYHSDFGLSKGGKVCATPRICYSWNMLYRQAQRTDCSDHSFDSYTAEAVLALGTLAVIMTPLRRRQPTTQRQDNVVSAILSAWSLLADKASKGASSGFTSLILILLLWASSCHIHSQTSGLIVISRMEITHSITQNQFRCIHLVSWKIKQADISWTVLSLEHKLVSFIKQIHTLPSGPTITQMHLTIPFFLW